MGMLRSNSETYLRMRSNYDKIPNRLEMRSVETPVQVTQQQWMERYTDLRHMNISAYQGTEDWTDTGTAVVVQLNPYREHSKLLLDDFKKSSTVHG